MATRGVMYITLWVELSISFMQFSQKVYGFRQKESQGF